MTKYRRKPLVIEAFQMTLKRRQDNSEWPEWLHVAWQKDWAEEGSVSPSMAESNGKDRLVVCSLEKHVLVDWGDWIIKGIHGELYSCKPEVFSETYEAIEEQ